MNRVALAASTRTIWVVLCTPPDGKPFPEYVEGTEVFRVGGDLLVTDNGVAVRTYPAGSWATYCEWVTTAGFADHTVIRAGGAPAAVPPPRSASTTRAS